MRLRPWLLILAVILNGYACHPTVVNLLEETSLFCVSQAPFPARVKMVESSASYISLKCKPCVYFKTCNRCTAIAGSSNIKHRLDSSKQEGQHVEDSRLLTECTTISCSQRHHQHLRDLTDGLQTMQSSYSNPITSTACTHLSRGALPALKPETLT